MYRELKSLGLNKYEIKIYQTLLGYGKLDAKTISKHSHVPPTAVYPNLRSLLDMKLIQQFSGKTMYFEALPPKSAINSLIEDKKRKFSELKNKVIKDSEELLHSKEIIPEKEILKISQGKDPSKGIYFEAMQKAKKTYYIVGWYMVKIADKYELLRKLKKLVERDVDVRIITIGSYENKQWQLIKLYQEAGIKMRHYPLANFSILIVDGEECKITLKKKEKGITQSRYNVHIVDNDLAKAMNNYFLNLWSKAQLLEPDKYL
jgi:sugar-specific transcriptional regulator TrmB